MKYFCSKDCPDLCGFEFIKNNNQVIFKSENISYLKNNFLCSKLKKFYIREIENNSESYFNDINGNKEICNTESVINKLGLFLNSNIEKKILYLRGSGSIAYNMGYWDLLMSYFNNVYFIEGSPCDETGISAHIEDFGMYYNPVISNLEEVEVIFLFGKNAKVTSPHLYAYLKKLKNRRKKIVYIDPVFTDSASLSDYYVAINPGCDNILCALLLKKMKLIDENIDENGLLKLAGINRAVIDALTSMIKFKKTAFITGYGLQRYKNGKNIVQWINKLAYLTDNLEYLYYGRSSKSNLKNLNIDKKNLINVAKVVGLLKENYFDILFVVAANPAITYPDSSEWQRCLKKIKLIVVDTIETETTKYADYFIKVGGMFCQEDIQSSYFFHSLKTRKKRAINRFPSDIDIVKDLSNKLNFNINIEDINELINNEEPEKRKYKGKELPLIFPSKPDKVYQLLTNSHYAYLNSQYLKEDFEKDNFIYVANQIAELENIKDGDNISLYNKCGNISGPCKVSKKLNNVILIHKNRLLNGKSPNTLIESMATDAYNGLAYYDTYVSISKLNSNLTT
jgi:anaerobic selenocysteine-containing dehydrogenase